MTYVRLKKIDENLRSDCENTLKLVYKSIIDRGINITVMKNDSCFTDIDATRLKLPGPKAQSDDPNKYLSLGETLKLEKQPRFDEERPSNNICKPQYCNSCNMRLLTVTEAKNHKKLFHLTPSQQSRITTIATTSSSASSSSYKKNVSSVQPISLTSSSGSSSSSANLTRQQPINYTTISLTPSLKRSDTSDFFFPISKKPDRTLKQVKCGWCQKLLTTDDDDCIPQQGSSKTGYACRQCAFSED